MEVAFHSAPGLSTSLRAVGFEMDVAQLSRGRLEGSIRLGGSRQLPVVSIQTNQDLLLQGNRRPGVLPLSLNTPISCRWFAGRKYNVAHCMVFMPA